MKARNSPEVADKTVYMTNPEKFIHVFFSESAPEKAAKQEKNGVRYLLASMAAIMLVSAILFAAYMKSSEKTLNNLIREGRYGDCLLLAEKMFSENPENEDIRSIAMSAFAREIVRSGWPVKVRQGFFENARTILDHADKSFNRISDVSAAIRALKWVTDIEEHFSKRTPEMPIVIDRDEARVESLLETYDTNRKAITGILDRLAEETVEIRPRVYAHVNTLHTDRLLYIEAIRRLKAEIRNRTDAGKSEESIRVIEEFQRKYPSVGGLEALKKNFAKESKHDG